MAYVVGGARSVPAAAPVSRPVALVRAERVRAERGERRDVLGVEPHARRREAALEWSLRLDWPSVNPRELAAHSAKSVQ